VAKTEIIKSQKLKRKTSPEVYEVNPVGRKTV